MSYLKSRGFRPPKERSEEKNIAEKDAFQEQGQRMIDQLASHPYFIIGTVAAIIGAVVIAILISNWVHESRSARSSVFSEALVLWQGEKTKEGEQPVSADTTGRMKQALAKFGESAETLKGSFVGDVSEFYKAKAHYRLKEFDSAINIFRRLQGSSKIPQELLFGVYEGEAYCHFDRNDPAEAIKVWEKYYALKDAPLYRDFALYYIGLSYDRMNDVAKAVEYFKKLKAEFPESPLVSKVADRLPEEKKAS
jgi:tetratricopeptide (TPR) repeat protein